MGGGSFREPPQTPSRTVQLMFTTLHIVFVQSVVTVYNHTLQEIWGKYSPEALIYLRFIVHFALSASL